MSNSMSDQMIHTVRQLRKQGKLKVKFRWIDLSRVSPDRKKREIYVTKAFRTHIPSLAELLHLHYQKHSISYWNMFLDNWLHKCDRIIIAYAAIPQTIVCGLCFLIEGPYLEEDNITKCGHVKDIYVRLLCSNAFCGSMLIKNVQNTYSGWKHDPSKFISFERLKLYSEPNRRVIDFYIRNGFHMLSDVIYDTHSTAYPAMIHTIGSSRIILRSKESLIDSHEFVDYPSVEKTCARMYAMFRWYMSKWFRT